MCLREYPASGTCCTRRLSLLRGYLAASVGELSTDRSGRVTDCMTDQLMSAAVQLLGRALKKLPRQDVFVTTKVRSPSLWVKKGIAPAK